MRPRDMVRELNATGTTPPGGPSLPPHLTPVPNFVPSAPPDSASEEELEQKRWELRNCVHQLQRETDRLAGLERAHERARGERYAALEAVAVAERLVTDAKRHWHHHLVVAATGGEDVLGTPSPENAEFARGLRASQLRDADELVTALSAEISACENGLVGLRRQRDEAAGALISRSAAFLRLFERLQSAFAEIRSCRVAIREVSKLVTLASPLVDLYQIDQPTSAERFVGYRIDEDLVADWTRAAARLRDDADAPLPGAPGRQPDV